MLRLAMNRVVTSSLCATTVAGGGVAAMPYGFPAPYGAPYGAMYGAPYGAPVGMNTYQAPTVWQGDHVVSGGQPEWAAEDAAQHALNLANWRIKLLQVRLFCTLCAACCVLLARCLCCGHVRCSRRIT